MFNKSLYLTPSQSNHHIHNSNINVNRAPTDESVKLLREMEEAAQKEIEKSIHVKNNTFDMNVCFQQNFYNQEYDIIIRYKLNGNDYKTSVSIDMVEKDIRNITEIIVEHLAKDIVLNCFEPLANSLHGVFSNKF